MIADLCPIEGNPLCAGGHFHIDLANEAAEAVGGGANDEGSARRVPCPVSGNVHVRVNNRNPSYLRIAPMNHRIPIRSIDFRGAGDGVAADNPWTPVQRSGGAWHTVDAGVLARGGSGVVLRFTSAQGEVIESTTIIPTTGGNENVDLGVQFTDQDPSSGGACEFIPPAVVYGEEFGGIDEMRWIINPWGAAEAGPHGPYDQDCFAGSSCLRVRDLDQWTGFHLYYRQEFRAARSAPSLQARTESGTGMDPGHPQRRRGQPLHGHRVRHHRDLQPDQHRRRQHLRRCGPHRERDPSTTRGRTSGCCWTTCSSRTSCVCRRPPRAGVNYSFSIPCLSPPLVCGGSST
ncbi:MAG: hypothetical protein IPN77_30590 [Sandaracinaceae bacterium]|nr:hypothetical protein [Sandaracinaceae bacterium]